MLNGTRGCSGENSNSFSNSRGGASNSGNDTEGDSKFGTNDFNTNNDNDCAADTKMEFSDGIDYWSSSLEEDFFSEYNFGDFESGMGERRPSNSFKNEGEQPSSFLVYADNINNDEHESGGLMKQLLAAFFGDFDDKNLDENTQPPKDPDSPSLFDTGANQLISSRLSDFSHINWSSPRRTQGISGSQLMFSGRLRRNSLQFDTGLYCASLPVPRLVPYSPLYRRGWKMILDPFGLSYIQRADKRVTISYLARTRLFGIDLRFGAESGKDVVADGDGDWLKHENYAYLAEEKFSETDDDTFDETDAAAYFGKRIDMKKADRRTLETAHRRLLHLPHPFLQCSCPTCKEACSRGALTIERGSTVPVELRASMPSTVHVDFLGPFPESIRGARTVLGSRFTGTSRIDMRPLASAEAAPSEVADVINSQNRRFRLKSVYRVRSDNGSCFKSALFASILRILGVKQSSGKIDYRIRFVPL